MLLSLEGEVKVTDFGIAKARGAVDAKAGDAKAGDKPSEDSPQLQGKFAYMSPEQARGEAVDARSDLFSLGIVLYECLAGVNPFSAPTTFETMRRVQACEYPPIEILRSDTPADLIALVKQALAKEPEARFADAGRMYEALLGTKVSVPTLDGPVTLTIPPGTSGGAKLRIKGRGIERGSEKGDQFVEVRVVVPKGLDDTDKAEIEKLAAKYPVNARADVGW